MAGWQYGVTIMTKFKRGDWVKRGRRLGVVRRCVARSAMVCWVGHQKAKRCGACSLKFADPPRALVLEGSLDGELHSTRSEEELLRRWLSSINGELAYKNVHALSDLSILADSIGNRYPPFIHISCHGAHDDGKAYVLFAPKDKKKTRIYLNDEKTVEAFSVFANYSVLFSACLLGRYEDEVHKFRKAAGLKSVAAFTREVQDSETMLFELMLYQGMLVNGWTFKTAVEKAEKAARTLNVKGTSGHKQKFVRLF